LNKKLYYLSHPYTSIGNTTLNIIDNNSICSRLRFEGINVLNALSIVTGVTDEEELAMNKCIKLLKACDALILSGNWELSRGCLKELAISIHLRLEIYVYDEKLNVINPWDSITNTNYKMEEILNEQISTNWEIDA